MNFAGVLCLVFVVLKLVGVITWSWWIVLFPFTIWFAAISFIFVTAAVVTTLAAFRTRWRKK